MRDIGALLIESVDQYFNHGTRDPFFSMLKCESECESSRNFETATLQLKQSFQGII